MKLFTYNADNRKFSPKVLTPPLPVPTFRGQRSPTMVVAIDPGKYLVGWAVLVGCGTIQAGIVEAGSPSTPQGHRWLALAKALEAKIKPPGDVTLVAEVMTVYAHDGASKAPTLLDLQGVVGACVGVLRPRQVVLVEPRVWKGQVPREVTTNRVWAIHEKTPGIFWPKDKKKQGDVAAALALLHWHIKSSS